MSIAPHIKETMNSKGASVIRKMFEEGALLKKKYGEENVYDFSLGNPNVAAPAAVKQAIIELLEEEDPVVLHGYSSNSGYEEVEIPEISFAMARLGRHNYSASAWNRPKVRFSEGTFSTSNINDFELSGNEIRCLKSGRYLVMFNLSTSTGTAEFGIYSAYGGNVTSFASYTPHHSAMYVCDLNAGDKVNIDMNTGQTSWTVYHAELGIFKLI